MQLKNKLQQPLSYLKAHKLAAFFVAAAVILLVFAAQQLLPFGQWVSFLLIVALLAMVALPPLTKKENRRFSLCPVLLGIVQGVASVSYLSGSGSFSPIVIVVGALAVAVVFSILFTGLFVRLSHIEPSLQTQKKDVRTVTLLTMALSFFALALAWSTVFPANCTMPDTLNQLMQVTGTIPYSNVHTIAHTLLLALFYRIDPSLMLLMLVYCLGIAYLYGLFSGYLYRRGVSYPLILFALTPFLLPKLTASLYMLPFKDVPYSFCVGIVTYLLMRFLDDGALSVPKSIALGLCLAFSMLFRLNGVIITIFCGLFFLIAFIKRRQFASLLSVGLTAVFCIVGMSVVSDQILHAESPDNGFSVQVFGAGITAVVAENGNITPEQEARIETALPVDWMTSHYAPWQTRPLIWSYDDVADASADPRTAVFNNHFVLAMGEHKAEVIRLYAELFFQNPLLCLREIAFSTYCVWGWQIESVQFYYTNSFLTCLLLLAFFAKSTSERKRQRLLMLLPIACNMLSIAISTITNEMRYLMPTFLLAPVILLYFFTIDTKQEQPEKAPEC